MNIIILSWYNSFQLNILNTNIERITYIDYYLYKKILNRKFIYEGEMIKDENLPTFKLYKLLSVEETILPKHDTCFQACFIYLKHIHCSYSIIRNFNA